MALTNETLRDYLRKTLEYPRECTPLYKGSLLVQTARRQLETADDGTLNKAHENLIKLDKQLQQFFRDAEVTKEGLTLEELSSTLPKLLPSLDCIIFYNGKNIMGVIADFIDRMCEHCGFDTI